jgi:hypothetical protein
MKYERRSIDLRRVCQCLTKGARRALFGLVLVITSTSWAIRTVARFTLMPPKIRKQWRPEPVIGLSRRCSMVVLDGLLIAAPLALVVASLW